MNVIDKAIETFPDTTADDWRMVGLAAVHKSVTPGGNCHFPGPAIIRCGIFYRGIFRGGEFHGGIFYGGIFRGGEFHGGDFHGGIFRGGEFHGGIFHGGEFRGGEFRGGNFYRGEFHGGSGGTDNVRTTPRRAKP